MMTGALEITGHHACFPATPREVAEVGLGEGSLLTLRCQCLRHRGARCPTFLAFCRAQLEPVRAPLDDLDLFTPVHHVEYRKAAAGPGVQLDIRFGNAHLEITHFSLRDRGRQALEQACHDDKEARPKCITNGIIRHKVINCM